ncbi:hypothetical protein TSOC_004140 [Tetrabaena socialis]|uniref:G-patch domain-containing protein n=1 Tax=Tetrabaena socialis TaxID=47790 RepID=A0A2J8A9Q0_9CHLO|nr:hypothetical protein TSOC_004140 [Tetrabaena socialis]|eukprot:PNH09254.1 hypothetical protein TSOC_004140 [Tetrabaena socialis]
MPQAVKFRSAGKLAFLDPYVSPAVGSGPGVGNQVQRVTERHWTGGERLEADNVGFKLLEKAGWRGSGLGAGEQGRKEPVLTALPKGNRGIGFDPTLQQPRRGSTEARNPGSHGPPGQQPQHPQQLAAQPTARARMAKLAREELESESVDAKVKRHRQLTRTEAEQERGRAIAQYLASAFSDPFDHLHSDNSNPLGRSHKLTASNPLLDTLD